jgi:hypothetical protein
MYLQLVASLVAASAAPALALPATTPNTKSAFVVNQEPAGQVLMSGPIQLAKVYGKYAHTGAVAPADVKAAAAAAQSGSVSANPQQVCRVLTLLGNRTTIDTDNIPVRLILPVSREGWRSDLDARLRHRQF